MIDETMSLRDLRAHFLATSTTSMPLAGMISWAALGVASLALPEKTIAMLALYIMAAILPLAFLLDRMKGRNLFGKNPNPLLTLFMLSILVIALVVPIAVLGARGTGDPMLIVLGMAILTGVIWIPYGWAVGDATGIRHAIARAVGSYAAYAIAPAQYRATAICAVVVIAYVYSLVFMKRPGGQAA